MLAFNSGMACMEVIMTATRDAREIADRAISYADKLWHLSIADVLILAKEHLALLERVEKLAYAVKYCAAQIQTIGDGFDAKNVYVVGINEMNRIEEALVQLDSEAKT